MINSEKIISQEETDRIFGYMKENYESIGTMGRSNDLTHATRDLMKNDQFYIDVFLSVCNGDNFRSAHAYLRACSKNKQGWKNTHCHIEKQLFSLEGLQELESKAKELEQFTLNLGLWK